MTVTRGTTRDLRSGVLVGAERVVETRIEGLVATGVDVGVENESRRKRCAGHAVERADVVGSFFG